MEGESSSSSVEESSPPAPSRRWLNAEDTTTIEELHEGVQDKHHHSGERRNRRSKIIYEESVEDSSLHRTHSQDMLFSSSSPLASLSQAAVERAYAAVVAPSATGSSSGHHHSLSSSRGGPFPPPTPSSPAQLHHNKRHVQLPATHHAHSLPLHSSLHASLVHGTQLLHHSSNILSSSHEKESKLSSLVEAAQSRKFHQQFSTNYPMLPPSKTHWTMFSSFSPPSPLVPTTLPPLSTTSTSLWPPYSALWSHSHNMHLENLMLMLKQRYMRPPMLWPDHPGRLPSQQWP